MKIHLETDNAAFHDECGGNWDYEVASILTELANRIRDGYRPDSLLDTNGNTVCYVTYEDGE